MSNVLIGIIGVILFIGLALAGALILGSDFSTASNSAKAAALVSQLNQTASAVEMYRLKTGNRYVPSIEANFLIPRFLKVPPVNPMARARNDNRYLYTIYINNNIYVDGYREPAYLGKFVMTSVGPLGDPQAEAICLEIAQTYGATTIADYRTNVDPNPTQPVGCVIAAGSASLPAADRISYVAYQRIERYSIDRNTASGWTGG